MGNNCKTKGVVELLMGGRGTYCYLGGDQIDLVQDEDQVLVRRLSTDVLLDTATTGAIRVTGIQDVEDNITGVDDLVQLVPDTLGGSLHEDELSCASKVAVLVLLVTVARGA